MEVTEFARIYLALFYSAVAIFYTARIVFMQRAFSQEMVFPGDRFCLTWWNHLSFRVFRMSIWLICVARVFNPSVDNYLGVCETLQTDGVVAIGLLLLTVGFILTITIHFKLGEQWRSGIDPRGPASIVTTGWYRYSRNPMFVCVAIAQIGFFLALPSIFSFVCLVVGFYTLNSQTLEEEKHLFRLFPKDYRSYSSRVRRWI